MEQAQMNKLTEYGMDVPSTMARFGGNEALMMRFLLNFPQDKTMDSLRQAMADGDKEAIKVGAHSLKGLSGNLGLTPLFEASSEMMNALRSSEECDVDALYQAVVREYDSALEMIATLG